MGVCVAPNIFQGKMSAIMEKLEFVIFYLNDLIIITLCSFEDHLAKFEEVMNQFQLSGLKCKIDKCKFLSNQSRILGINYYAIGYQTGPE